MQNQHSYTLQCVSHAMTFSYDTVQQSWKYYGLWGGGDESYTASGFDFTDRPLQKFHMSRVSLVVPFHKSKVVLFQSITFWFVILRIKDLIFLICSHHKTKYPPEPSSFSVCFTQSHNCWCVRLVNGLLCTPNHIVIWFVVEVITLYK